MISRDPHKRRVKCGIVTLFSAGQCALSHLLISTSFQKTHSMLGCAGEATGGSTSTALGQPYTQDGTHAQGQGQGQGLVSNPISQTVQASGLAQFVGDVQQMAQAWLGGASHAAMQDSSSDTEMSEAETDSDEEERFDEEGSPRGTKGRDM